MKLKLILLVLLYSYFSTAQIPDNFEFLEHNYWGHTMGASCFIDGDFYFVSAGECYSESRLYKIHNNQQPTEVSKLFGSTSKLVTLSDSSAMIITYDESCHLILQGFSTITISPQGLEVNDYYKNGSEENIQCEEILDQLPVSSDIVYSPEKGFYILDEINSKLCFLDMNCQLSCKTSTGAESLFIDNNEDVYMITKSEDRVSILKTNDALDQTLVRTLPFDYEQIESEDLENIYFQAGNNKLFKYNIATDSIVDSYSYNNSLEDIHLDDSDIYITTKNNDNTFIYKLLPDGETELTKQINQNGFGIPSGIVDISGEHILTYGTADFDLDTKHLFLRNYRIDSTLIGYRRLYFDVSSLEAELISEELIDFHILPNRDTFFEINYTYSLKVEFFNNTFGFFQNPSLWMKEPRSRTSEVLSKWSYHPQKLFQTLLPEVIDTTIIFNSYKPDFITVGIPGADYKFNRSIVMTQELMISSNENYIESSSINLYPNPTTEHVSWEENVPVYIAIVYNTDGTPVLHKQRQNLKSIDLSRQSAGIYYIQLITIHGKKLPPQKIIKM